MRIPRVYADTSVFGGVFDEEFQVPSTRFFDQVRSGRFVLVTSTLVREEIQTAPAHVQGFFDEVTDTAELIVMSDGAVRLQTAYVNAGVVTERSTADALHVALASVAGCGLIVSWNFRHIVNYR